jgi:hypothetical protein
MLITLLVVISIVLLFVMDDDKKDLVLNEYYRNEYTWYQKRCHDSMY